MAATATAEKPRTAEKTPDDYYHSEGASDYDSYSEEDPDEPITESDNENEEGQPQQQQQQLQRRRKLQQQEADYDEDEEEYSDSDEYSDDYDDDEDGAVAPWEGNNAMQQNRQQGGGRMEPAADAKKGIDEEDGLKLKLDVNLDIEIELKAAIHGDLTLSLLA